MGDIADMILEGNMCQYCGEILDPKGYPAVCAACQQEMGIDEYGNKRPEKVQCPKCGKRVKKVGLGMHMIDKHGVIHGVIDV